MTELPQAIIDNPPLHRRPWVRKLGIAIAVVAALLVAKKLWHAAWRSDSNKQLEKAQSEARKRVGNALDPMFDDQLDNDDTALLLDAKFDVTRTPDVTDSACENGLTAAFDEALGKNVVVVTTSDWKGHAPHLGVTATFTPTDQVFQLPHSDKTYTGVAMSADVKFLDKAFHVDVKPAEEFEFSYVRDPMPLGGIDDFQVKSGIAQGACQQLGYAILEKVTTWRRPTVKPRDPVKDCEHGFGCSDNAEQVAAKDPAAAAKMYQAACDDRDQDACLRAADLELSLAKGHDDHYIRAELGLEMSCSSDLAKTCAAAARVLLTPQAGKPPSDYERDKALPFLLRGCDLGDADACTAAAPVVKQSKQFAEAAPLFTGATAARSKTYGSIFALKWGQWTALDPGQPTLWVTKEPAHPDDTTLVRRFDRSELPKGLVIPDNVDVVYAIARKEMGDVCAACKPSGGGEGAFAFRALDCVCVIAR
jgi:hypothetical protein